MEFSPETLFKTVEGKPQGQKTKDAQDQHKFKIDQAFIQKVLEFETSSPLLRNAMFSYSSKLLTVKVDKKFKLIISKNGMKINFHFHFGAVRVCFLQLTVFDLISGNSKFKRKML